MGSEPEDPPAASPRRASGSSDGDGAQIPIVPDTAMDTAGRSQPGKLSVTRVLRVTPSATHMPAASTVVGSRPELERAAREINQAKDEAKRQGKLNWLLPRPMITRPDTSLSHYITDGDLHRLNSAGGSSRLSTMSQLLLGAVLGSAFPAIGILLKISSVGIQKLEVIDYWTGAIILVLMGGTVVALLHGMGSESVRSICKEIRDRQQLDAD